MAVLILDSEEQLVLDRGKKRHRVVVGRGPLGLGRRRGVRVEGPDGPESYDVGARPTRQGGEDLPQAEGTGSSRWADEKEKYGQSAVTGVYFRHRCKSEYVKFTIYENFVFK